MASPRPLVFLLLLGLGWVTGNCGADFAAALVASAAPRVWTRDDGKTVTATYVSKDEDNIRIRLRNGRVFTIPLTTLSAADRDYVEARLKEEAVEKEKNGVGKGAPPASVPGTDLPEVNPREFKRDGIIDFAGLRFTVLETPHFLIYTKGVNGPRAGENAEILWRRMALGHPDFRSLFAADPEDRIRLAVFLVDRKSDWEAFLSWYSMTLRNLGDVRGANSAEATWPHTSGQHVYVDAASARKLGIRTSISVINCERLPDKNKVECAFRTHNLGVLLAQTNMQGKLGEMPMWMTQGYGYYCEIDFCKRTATHLLDYESYDLGDGSGGDVLFGKQFKDGRNWKGLIQEMARKGKPEPSVHKVLAAEVGALSPELCGYVYAFVDFIHSTPELTNRYAALLKDPKIKSLMRAPAELAAAFGFASTGAMETAWKEYLLSPEFH